MQSSTRRRPTTSALSPVTLNNQTTKPTRQSTRNVTPIVQTCSACSQPVYTSTISNVLDRSWHPECVRCVVCRCSLTDQCYSRDGKLFCKDDFIKKFLHRCFACQNLIQSHEMIRRIRPGRLYHADCFVCCKCKQILQNEDIKAQYSSDGTTFNDMQCLCQTCSKPTVKNEDEEEEKEAKEISNGKHSPPATIVEEKEEKSSTPPPPPSPPPPTKQNKTKSPAKPKSTSKSRSPTKRTKTPVTPSRTSQRRGAKTSRYRKRRVQSGSEDEFSEDDDIDDEEIDEEKIEVPPLPSPPKVEQNGKHHPAPPKEEKIATPPPPPPPQPTKLAEPLSLLSGLASNPMSISSIMKPDVPMMNSKPATLPRPPPEASDNESLDRSSSPSQMDVSTNADQGTSIRPTPPAPLTKPSALSSLLEFGTIPPSTLGDIRPNGLTAPPPFSFPFGNPAAGVPFSPQAAAGMATFYRPPFGVPPASMPLDMSNSGINSKKDEDAMESSAAEESNSPKKKVKGKGKKNGNVEHSASPPPPPPSTSNSKKKKVKSNPTDNGNSNEDEEKKNQNPHAQNLLAQMSLLNNSFLPGAGAGPQAPNGKNSPTNAQLAAMYNMAPHFAAYNPFPGAFNPAFAAAAYASGYPNPYGFHPAFPFMPPMTTATTPTPTPEEKKSRPSKKKLTNENENSVDSIPKRRTSETESDELDENSQSQPFNGKSHHDESDESNANNSKKGGRTTIKPQQLDILCKAFEVNSKPNKAQREALVAETGLNLRVIQVWFQNKRSKERKGKGTEKKDSTNPTNADDDDDEDDSQQSPPSPSETS